MQINNIKQWLKIVRASRIRKERESDGGERWEKEGEMRNWRQRGKLELESKKKKTKEKNWEKLRYESGRGNRNMRK